MALVFKIAGLLHYKVIFHSDRQIESLGGSEITIAIVKYGADSCIVFGFVFHI